MKIHITNLIDHNSSCPTQFSFEVVDHPKYESGYIRYRWGIIGCELYKKGVRDQDNFSTNYGDSFGGGASFKELRKALKDNTKVNLKWDGKYESYEA